MQILMSGSSNYHVAFSRASPSTVPMAFPFGRLQVNRFSLLPRGSSPMSVFSKSATGAGAEQLLLKSVTGIWDWSRDGKFVLYTVDGREITAVSLVGDKTPFVYLPRSNFFQSQARFSPDGRFVAYASNESGRVEVYVRSFPNPSSKWQISTGGGSSPRWRKDGQELFYVAADQKLTAVPIRTAAGGLDIGQPVPLFENRVALGRY